MPRYSKPSIKVKKIKLNSFLVKKSMRDPFSGFSSFLQVGTAFGYGHFGGGQSIAPPATGDSGLAS